MAYDGSYQYPRALSGMPHTPRPKTEACPTCGYQPGPPRMSVLAFRPDGSRYKVTCPDPCHLPEDFGPYCEWCFGLGQDLHLVDDLFQSTGKVCPACGTSGKRPD